MTTLRTGAKKEPKARKQRTQRLLPKLRPNRRSVSARWPNSSAFKRKMSARSERPKKQESAKRRQPRKSLASRSKPRRIRSLS